MNTNNDFTLRLNPLPRKMDILGEASFKPSDLIVSVPDKNVWARRAAVELSLFIRARTGCEPLIMNELPDAQCAKTCVILLSERERPLFQDQFQDPFFDAFNLNPGFQAYRMRCLIENNRILIQGLSEEGVYWGMKTLKQLMLASKRSIRMPRVMIVDGADMEERGIWTGAFSVAGASAQTRAQAEKRYCERIDWMSDNKLNLIEVAVINECGLTFRSKKHPSFSRPDAATTEYLTRRLIQYGEERGVRIIPTITHTEHLAFISRRFPELKARNVTQCHGQPVALPIDYFNEKAAAILKDLVEEMTAIYNPRGICFWLAEYRLHPLTGAGQKQSYFMREAKVFAEAVEQARQKNNPNLEYRILLSQGSYPENSRLIHSLPKDVKWIFYSGERCGTYAMRPTNPIHADISRAAQEGYWISLCNQMCGAGGRSTVFEILHKNIGHAIGAGLKAVDGMSFAFPGDRQALFIAAQHTWNYQGRSLDETFLAYAANLQVADPVSHAQACRLADQASFTQTIRDASVCVGYPAGTFSRFKNMLERIKTNAPVDELIMITIDAMEVDDIPALSKAVTDLEKALGLMDAKADRIGYLRCKVLLCLVRISLDITRCFYINCREKCWDFYKGPWDDFREEIRLLVTEIEFQAKQSTAFFTELVRLENGGGSADKRENPLVTLASFAASIDTASITSSREIDSRT